MFSSSHQWGKLRSEKRPESEHSPSTAFVSNLLYSFTNSQLEETFSDVGPIWRCFMICCCCCGCLACAATEDATRAIELKNGSSVGGRKIGVKHAVESNPRFVYDAVETKNDTDGFTSTVDGHGSRMPKLEKPVQPRKVAALCADLADKENCSEKQRVTRTVIFGGLRNTEMAEAVHRCAKESGMVCAVTYPLPKEELDQHGLAQDGCKMDASVVLFTSVKLAHVAGGIVWARQLGGEGAKTQKWKLIIRNLPFKAKLNEIKDMFSVAGFVWDVFFPHNSEKGYLLFIQNHLKLLSKGFAIVKFTRKQDAENAIQKFNWKMFGKRPIAVHWAVPKRLYSGGTNAAVASDDDGLQSPNFHVSKTRFVIYKLLKSMTKKELKQFCIDAVTSQATKQKPIKFLKTVKKGKVVIKNQSRGVAFDQFSEHQHALGALRVLNNNPEMFGPKHRPIVEFAVDNVQTLKLRKAKLQAQQQDASDDSNNAHQNAEDDKRTRKHSGFKKSKMEDTVGEGEANKKPKLNPAGEKTKPSPSKENSEGSNRNSKGSNRKSKNCKTDPKPVVGSSDNVETNVNDTHKLKSKKVEAVSKPKERTRQG
ncbi:hypothetical protein ES332_D02G272200v1 [Gossypium tomentosum]|uniref:RRM domain-containing protein n=1 Tax=Gossypium tomentosum TaxID=34277 RepID=A0A5D2M2D6_GOSTO|nr:hypothetical protein ES332_D02G272200v1 [Gossypium tomentosum]